jgi:hypothetical protein
LISGIGAGPLGLDSPTLFLKVFFFKKIVKKLHLNKINEIIIFKSSTNKIIFFKIIFGYFFIALLLNVISFSLSFMDLSLFHDLDPESGELTQVDLSFFLLFF